MWKGVPLLARVFVVLLLLLNLSCAGGSDSVFVDSDLPQIQQPNQPNSQPNDETTNTDDEQAPEVLAQLGLSWSDPETWGGTLPQAGDSVVIPEGMSVILDANPPALSGLTIHGELIFAEQDLQLTSHWIMVHGTLQIGREDTPYTHQALIRLTGTPDQNMMDMGSRGIMVMGGRLLLYGAVPEVPWTKINQHIQNGENELNLLENTQWQAGDQIVLAPTDFYGVSQTELLEISSSSGDQLNTTTPVNGFRWGLMQYATDSGMSLTPDGSVVAPDSEEEGITPLSLDERAEVGNLTRNIVIESIDDTFWQDQGFGAHIMIMNLASTVHVNGIEVRRAGQAGILGRYPFHWHILSYDEDGNEIGDATGHYVRGSTFHESANRCITIHGTNGVRVEDNICFDILGHGIFFEDAVERRNTVEGNLVLRVRNPSNENALKMHETNMQVGVETGSSCIWVSNPDNTVRGNMLADCEGFGLWMAFPESPVGANAHVPMRPNRLQLGDFDHNTTHSNQRRGVMLDNVEIDNEGRVDAIQYASTIDGQSINSTFDNVRRFTIRGMSLWKNGDGNFWNRVTWPTYKEFVSADAGGKFFAGSGTGGLITRSLVIGNSLNNFSPRPRPWMGPPTAFATYHSAFDMRDNVIMNFPHVPGQTSGAFATDDYYFRPVEKGHIRNPNNLMINLHPGFRSNAAVDENITNNFAQGYSYYVFAGALWDPYGLWGDPNTWNVYNELFFTHGANCSMIEPASQNAASCDGEYFGVDSFILDEGNLPWDDLMGIHVTRFDDNNPDLPIDTWEVTGAQPGWALWHMRHFAAHDNGTYLLDFPSSTTPSDVAMDIHNMHQASDTLVLAVRFSGAEEAQVYTSTYHHPIYMSEGHASSGSFAYKHNYTELTSRQAVLDSAGETYWQDHANNLVWVRVTLADLEQFPDPIDIQAFADPELSDEVLYNPLHLRIW